MSKIKRNEACPCGSGKKFKKCCGASFAGNVNLEQINMQLDQLHQQFISFATKNYQKQISEKLNDLKSPKLNQDQDLTSVYQIGLIVWLLLNVPIVNGQTLFHTFYHRQASKLNPITKNIFGQWRNHSPSVYEVLSINRSTKRLKIKEILTVKTYEVPYNDQDKFKKGSLIIGTVVPYAGLQNFFYQMINLYDYNKEEMKQVIEKHMENNQLVENFPSFLLESLMPGLGDDSDINKIEEKNQEVNGSSSMQDQVADLFSKHMREKQIEESIIAKGVSIWTQFYDKENPSFNKIEPYAAALEYLTQKLYVSDTQVTQGQLAKEYQTSPGTISTNYRKLVQGLKNDYEEIAKL